jgi:hypothetical protein
MTTHLGAVRLILSKILHGAIDAAPDLRHNKAEESCVMKEGLYPTKYKCYSFNEDDWMLIMSRFHEPVFLFSVLRVKGRFLGKLNHFSSKRAELLENVI